MNTYSVTSHINLTKLVLSYQQGQTTKDELLHHMYSIAYSYPLKKRLLQEEEAADFLIFFLPTIEGMIKNFSYEGKPFEHYLHCSIRNKIRSYKSTQYKKTAKEIMSIYAIREEHVVEDFQDYVCESHSPAYQIRQNEDKKHQILIKENHSRQSMSVDHARLLYLLLICYRNIPTGQMEAIGELYLSYDIDFHALVHRLDETCSKQLASIERLQNRKSRLFSEIILLETQIMHEPDPEFKVALENKLSIRQSQLQQLLKRLNGRSPRPSHRQIAELLKVPKGSVDSGVYYLKKNLKLLLDDE